MSLVTFTERTSNCFNQWVLSTPRRQALPIAVYPGLALTGATVQEVVTRPEAQVAAQLALRARYHTPALLSAMDLSAEAEAFGCSVHMSATEVPSVTGRLITCMQAARELTVPEAGTGRTGVYLETVRRLRAAADGLLVLGGCIGPFSLAARLVGVSEAMELTVAEPELMEVLLEKSAAFLTAYLQAFKAAGADGAIMAEPAAGLLSPRMMASFSSAYIRQIGKAVSDGRFALVLHNCAAKALHLPAILETGLQTFHFGAPMDLSTAFSRVAPEVVICGNLDPTGVFVQSTPDEVARRTRQVLSDLAAHRNFVISSGCDVPPNTPLVNLDAFYGAVQTAG